MNCDCERCRQKERQTGVWTFLLIAALVLLIWKLENL